MTSPTEEMNALVNDLARPLGQELRRQRGALSRELGFQNAIEAALKCLGVLYSREHILGPKDRPDFLLTDKGLVIEVKKESEANIWRQVARYVEYPEVTGAIVVAPRLIAPGDACAGKPIRVMELWKLLL